VNSANPADGKIAGPGRPLDACPWPRPFPPGFDQCPAYLQTHFIPIDISNGPLPPVLSCHHLVTRALAHRKGGWYAACEIGDELARRQWLAEADAG